MEKYAGIDIAKKIHWMCVTDAEGRFLMEPRPYANDAEGLSRMVADLDLCGGDVAVGMESTGCYWRSCYKVLAEGGYPVSVINPVVTCAERKSGNLGRAKTDRVDCLVVADALRKQGIPPTPSPDADAAQLRDLCRFRRAVSESLSRAKIQAVALLDQVWPEYGKLFSDKFGDSSRAVLRRLASGDMDSDALADDLRGASRNRFGAAKASDVLESLRSTCGVPATDALRLQLRLLLDQLDFCAAQLAEIDAEADALLDAVAPTLPTVPGIGRATAAQIAAEVGDVQRFADAKSLVVSATAKSAERATLSRRRRPRFPAGGATALWPPALPRAAAQGALDRGVVEVRGPDLNLQRRGALGVPGRDRPARDLPSAELREPDRHRDVLCAERGQPPRGVRGPHDCPLSGSPSPSAASASRSFMR